MSALASQRALDLPPAYRLLTLRELDDAFVHGCRIAADRGAGTLVWVRRFDVAEFAVVLEPEEPLAEARRAFLVGMNALADALTGVAPPTMAVSFDWPDGIRIDGVLVGGGRLGWPDCAEEDVPDWLVFSAMVRTAVIRASDPGMRPLLGGLDEIGFEAIDAGEIVASFARHLMAGFHDWAEEGFGAVEERYLSRVGSAAVRGDPTPNPSPQGGGGPAAFEGDGRARLQERAVGLRPPLWGRAGVGVAPSSAIQLREALLAPSWRDPQTGMPWL